MRTHKHIEESIKCEICGYDITGDKPEDYLVYRNDENKKNIITLQILSEVHYQDQDVCEECKAKLMLLSLLRRWSLGKDGSISLTDRSLDNIIDINIFDKLVKKKWTSTSNNWINESEVNK